MQKTKFKKIYRSKNNKMKDSDAEIIGQELEKIEEKYDGIKPRIVVEEASNPSSPLHKYFEWENDNAANKWRIWQARWLIANIVIEVKQESAEPLLIRPFVSVSNGSKRYVSIETALTNEEYFEQIVGDCIQELDHWREKYDSYPKLRQLLANLDSDIENIKKKLLLKE